MGEYDIVDLREPVHLPEPSSLMQNLGVFDITDKAIMCSPRPQGSPPQQTAITGQTRGMVPETQHTVYTPGLQCFWQIIPRVEAEAINLHFMQMTTGNNGRSSSGTVLQVG